MTIKLGKVVKNSGDKTLSVAVVTTSRNNAIKKIIKKTKKYKVHDEFNKFKVGDVVQFKHSRPISKTKFFKVIYERSKKQ